MSIQDFCSATECKDDLSVDCAHMDSIFGICADITHAKAVCPRFCSLCNVGKYCFVFKIMFVRQTRLFEFTNVEISYLYHKLKSICIYILYHLYMFFTLNFKILSLHRTKCIIVSNFNRSPSVLVLTVNILSKTSFYLTFNAL